MTSDDIKAVMDKEPMLTSSGIGASAPSRFQVERAELLQKQEVDRCSHTEDWVKHLDKIQTFNTNHSSYDLKHRLESTVGYCTNGASTSRQ